MWAFLVQGSHFSAWLRGTGNRGEVRQSTGRECHLAGECALPRGGGRKQCGQWGQESQGGQGEDRGISEIPHQTGRRLRKRRFRGRSSCPQVGSKFTKQRCHPKVIYLKNSFDSFFILDYFFPSSSCVFYVVLSPESSWTNARPVFSWRRSWRFLQSAWKSPIIHFWPFWAGKTKIFFPEYFYSFRCPFSKASFRFIELKSRTRFSSSRICWTRWMSWLSGVEWRSRFSSSWMAWRLAVVCFFLRRRFHFMRRSYWNWNSICRLGILCSTRKDPRLSRSWWRRPRPRTSRCICPLISWREKSSTRTRKWARRPRRREFPTDWWEWTGVRRPSSSLRKSSTAPSWLSGMGEIFLHPFQVTFYGVIFPRIQIPHQPNHIFHIQITNWKHCWFLIV